MISNRHDLNFILFLFFKVISFIYIVCIVYIHLHKYESYRVLGYVYYETHTVRSKAL